MARQRIVSSDDQQAPAAPSAPLAGLGAAASSRDDRLDEQLRPQRLKDVIGQREVIERLEIALDAAQKRGEPLGHILFDGPPGLGKTTFATVIPREMGADVQIANGASMVANKDMLPYLTNASAGSVLFIDEIHRLPKAVEEFLYPVMEDFRVDIALGEGANARTINMQLKPFTIIGATTRSGMLSAPLRDRFHMREHLDFYSVSELREIVTRSAAKLKVDIRPDAAEEIAVRSRGTPRLANHRLRWVRDYATSKADGKVTMDIAQAALDMQRIDPVGLDAQDRRYLETLVRVFGGGPAGLEALAHTMNTAADTLSDEVEPFLLRMEFIVRTPRGRKVTPEGYVHLGLPRPTEEPGGPQRRLFE